MALRHIRLEDDPILRKTSKEVKEITPAVITLLDDLAETMHSADGVGFAAPQVGILKRICVVDIEEENGLVELINPEVLEESGEQNEKEGCLSVPGVVGSVVRAMNVKVKAINRNGEPFELNGEGYLARALLHEIDHLNGIIFTDKAIIERETEEQRKERRRNERRKARNK